MCPGLQFLKIYVSERLCVSRCVRVSATWPLNIDNEVD